MAKHSWLFVPGDSERKLAKAATCSADAVIIDLEDAVSPEAKGPARMLARQWLESHRQQVTAGAGLGRWVRINPLDGPLWREDLAMVMPGQPDGIMVPKATGPDQLRILAAELYEHEQRAGMQINSTRILPLVGETARSALTISAYTSAEMPRLMGLTWGAEDLSAAIGASRKRDAGGEWTDAMRYVRTQVLLAAHARGALALDTIYGDYEDLGGLKKVAEESAADGFCGMLAIHPAQIEVINTAFTPGEALLEEARRIVTAFRENPGAGALALDGRLIEKPHLERAKRLLGFEETPVPSGPASL